MSKQGIGYNPELQGMVLLAQMYDDGWLPLQVQARADQGLLLPCRNLVYTAPTAAVFSAQSEATCNRHWQCGVLPAVVAT